MLRTLLAIWPAESAADPLQFRAIGKEEMARRKIGIRLRAPWLEIFRELEPMWSTNWD